MIDTIVDTTRAIERIAATTLPQLLTHYGIALSDQPAKTIALMQYVLTNPDWDTRKIMPLLSAPRLAMAFLVNKEKYFDFTGSPALAGAHCSSRVVRTLP